MKKLLPIAAALLMLSSCGTKTQSSSQSDDTAVNPCELSEDELNYRLRCDFTWTRSRVKEYIQQFLPEVTDAQIDEWTASQLLESRVFDGDTLYFSRTAANLFRVDSACRAIKEQAEHRNYRKESKPLDLMEQNVVSIENGNNPTSRIRVRYSISVEPDAVPAGDTIRCWMPFPRQDVARQTDVRMVSTSPTDVLYAPQSAMHSSIYMEQVAEAGKPTVFQEEFSYSIRGFRLGDPNPSTLNPQDFMGEQIPHVVFTDRMRHLSDSLCQGCQTPLEKARAIFRYIDQTTPWAGALEYSTIPCIPEYVLDQHHGDCGQQTLLFMTLCRIQGIPAHFQSGFYIEPNYCNLHDWCEIWIEEYGWIPVDQSTGILTFNAFNDRERCFYLGSSDTYRMIVNQSHSAPLYPAKWHPRSETVDFQRGEVEWRGGNLYFPKWNWDMEVTFE